MEKHGRNTLHSNTHTIILFRGKVRGRRRKRIQLAKRVSSLTEVAKHRDLRLVLGSYSKDL